MVLYTRVDYISCAACKLKWAVRMSGRLVTDINVICVCSIGEGGYNVRNGDDAASVRHHLFFQNYGQYICQTEYFNTTTCSYSLGDYYFIYIFFLFVDSVSRLTCIEKVA